MDRGRSLEETLTDSGKLLPTHISGLILAASRTGQLGEALFSLVELQQSTTRLRQELIRGLLYPFVVLFLACGILLFVMYLLTGMLKTLFLEFGMQLPMSARLLIWWRDQGIWLVGCFVVAVIVLAFVIRILGGGRRWCRLMGTMPLFGPLWHWASVAEWSGLLSVLLRNNVPLPDALRWAGRGTRDVQVGYLSMRLADGVARGRSLSQMLLATGEIPGGMVPLLEWGERTGNLAESFHEGQEMLSQCARMRSMLLQTVVPPVLYIFIGCMALFVVVGELAPMVSLITCLS